MIHGGPTHGSEVQKYHQELATYAAFSAARSFQLEWSINLWYEPWITLWNVPSSVVHCSPVKVDALVRAKPFPGSFGANLFQWCKSELLFNLQERLITY